MDASGGSQRLVVAGSEPAWSPDGTSLSYACRDGEDLCVVDLQSGSESVIVAATTSWPASAARRGLPTEPGSPSPGESADGDDYTNYRALFRVQPDGAGLTEIPNTYPEGGPTRVVPRRRNHPLHRALRRTRRRVQRRPILGPTGRHREDPAHGPVRQGPGRGVVARRAADRPPERGRVVPRPGGDLDHGPDGTSRALVVRNGSVPSWRPHFAPVRAAPTTTRLRDRAADRLRRGYRRRLRPVHRATRRTRARRLTSNGGVRNPSGHRTTKRSPTSPPRPVWPSPLRVMTSAVGSHDASPGRT